MPNMIIVGNGEPVRNLTTDIDAADLVMRFNACSSVGTGWAGSKTDIVCLRTFGSIGAKFAEGETIVHQEAIDRAEEF